MDLFLSTFENRIDRKGRLSVPAPFRAVLERRRDPLYLFKSLTEPCLEGCGPERIGQIVDAIDSMDSLSEEVATLQTMLSSAQEMKLDGEGRIMLSADFIGFAELDDMALYAGIGRSFQISNVLTDFAVIENAIIAEQARRDEAFRFFRPAFSDQDLIAGAMIVLERVGLQVRADDLVSDLAHGEWRLLELALALSGTPSLLLLDEPMAGAGPEETLHMTRVIESMRDNVGILLIEHDMDAVFRHADVITVLVEGQIIASGQPDEIRANRDVLAAYLGDEG